MLWELCISTPPPVSLLLFPPQWGFGYYTLPSSSGDPQCCWTYGYGFSAATGAPDLPSLPGGLITYACPVGMYGTAAGSAACAPCPAFMTAPAGSVGSRACVCAPGAGLNTSTGGCSPCLPGKYQPAAANATCAVCANGYTSAAGAAACSALFCAQLSLAGFTKSSLNADGVYALVSYFNGQPVWNRTAGSGEKRWWITLGGCD